MSDTAISGLEALDPFLYDVLQECGAQSGGIHLLFPPAGQVLGFAVKAGMPDALARPWTRLWVGSPALAAEAVRERRMVWLPVGDSLDRLGSSAEAPYSYGFACLSAPIASAGAVWGSLTLLFPASQPPRLTPRQHAAVGKCCAALGRLLADSSARGRPLLPAPEPHTMRQPPTERPTEANAVAAADFAQRLPEGGMALDPEGRITFVTARAAELIGVPVERLRGQRPWELPQLSASLFKDSYRTALLSREPTAFTVLRHPDTRLSFVLHPNALYTGDSGLSVRVSSSRDQKRPQPGTPPTTGGEAGGRPGTDGARALGSDTAPASLETMYELINLAATLTQAVEVADMVELIADPIMAMVDAQGLALLTLEDGRLQNVGFRGYAADAMRQLDGAQMRWMPTPASQALSKREAAFYSTPEEMDAVYDGMSTLTGKAAWAYLPLIASDRPVGCCVISYERPRTFPPGLRAVLTSLAGLLAQALDRALLHDARSNFAQRLQASFLPGVLPEVPGLRAAARYRSTTYGMEIGGDFYDLIGLSGGNAAAAVGDVQGHNPTAAALMGQVRTAVHATAGVAPSEVLSRTNQLLIDLNAGLFTSCLYADIDLATHRVRLANAGHPPPLLRHPDGTVSIVRVPPGPLLGIVRATEYPTIEIPLPPGAELLMYTDGLVEIPGTDPDVSTERLARVLASTSRGESVDTRADILLEAAPSAGSADDVALLLISVD
ncbi:hypothetical protein GCM10011583_09380 [Streptomyces camponoticapitis]|uniref:PPM-type phosphatase domain-containing protein n=1 Tax=Streptomyces camponoticapitis TaxID=1616125 RepID=A0ABQ2DZH0_9ACTN|nr:SpoIIE family protein phosphatase [Streptomyces camponoticapitis]GGJ79868.1 hypothetical protein GCM10011583_09380 [Streptomyces camponoticapitis]